MFYLNIWHIFYDKQYMKMENDNFLQYTVFISSFYKFYKLWFLFFFFISHFFHFNLFITAGFSQIYSGSSISSRQLTEHAREIALFLLRG